MGLATAPPVLYSQVLHACTTHRTACPFPVPPWGSLKRGRGLGTRPPIPREAARRARLACPQKPGTSAASPGGYRDAVRVDRPLPPASWAQGTGWEPEPHVGATRIPSRRPRQAPSIASPHAPMRARGYLQPPPASGAEPPPPHPAAVRPPAPSSGSGSSSSRRPCSSQSPADYTSRRPPRPHHVTRLSPRPLRPPCFSAGEQPGTTTPSKPGGDPRPRPAAGSADRASGGGVGVDPAVSVAARAFGRAHRRPSLEPRAPQAVRRSGCEGPPGSPPLPGPLLPGRRRCSRPSGPRAGRARRPGFAGAAPETSACFLGAEAASPRPCPPWPSLRAKTQA